MKYFLPLVLLLAVLSVQQAAAMKKVTQTVTLTGVSREQLNAKKAEILKGIATILGVPEDKVVSEANVIDVTQIENNGKVIFGSTVKVQDLETDKKISYRLVGQDEADIKKNLIFFKSPIGKALIGKNKGEMISVATPSGERNFEILDVEYI